MSPKEITYSHLFYTQTFFSSMLIYYFSTSCSPRGQLLQLKKEKLEYIPGEHEYGLFPAPIHVGEFQILTFIPKFKSWLIQVRNQCHLFTHLLCADLILKIARVIFFFFSGKYLRQKRIDFQLPYDILWLWKHDQVSSFTNHTLCAV